LCEGGIGNGYALLATYGKGYSGTVCWKSGKFFVLFNMVYCFLMKAFFLFSFFFFFFLRKEKKNSDEEHD
jgi:hypothetical protein